MSEKSTLPALAAAIADWFPDLGGRSIAVSEAEITKENIPALPLCMVALQNIQADHSGKSNAPPYITEDVLIQFILKPERYKKEDGSESPFWSYYDYDAIQDRLLGRMSTWQSPRHTRLALKSMDIEADQFAVVLTFRVTHSFRWCAPEHIAKECFPVADTAEINFQVFAGAGSMNAVTGGAQISSSPSPSSQPSVVVPLTVDDPGDAATLFDNLTGGP